MQDVTLNQLLLDQVHARPEKTALQFGGELLSYALLERRALQVAHGLIARGIRTGERVAYLGKNSLAYFEFLLGAAKAGAVTVPVNWRLAAPEITYVLENSRARLILVEPSFEELVAAIAPSIPRLVSGGGDTYTRWRDSQNQSAIETDVHPRAAALQLYTSGTTGRPKGAVLTHESLFGLRTSMDSAPEWYRWTPDDVSLIAMPIAHISGTGWGLWTLQAGATGIITREFNPHTIVELMSAHRISKIMMVPTALQLAARQACSTDIDFSFLRYLYYGGSPMPPDLLKECVKAFGCGFVQMYGMTETSGTVVALAPEDHNPDQGNRLGSVGKPLNGVELKIIDHDGNALPAGCSGEVAIRSKSNMAGYFEMPQATADALDSQGWLRTGDVGYLDSDGYLFLRDRVQDMIISGGENIYPTEVENAISGHPAVAEVAVIGIPDDKWGESVQAFVVTLPDTSPSSDEILAWAAGRIARFKLPKSIVFVSTLPRNHTGKVLRRELRALLPRSQAIDQQGK